MEVTIHKTLDRDKTLDEGIFLAHCGLSQIREGYKITGVVRLQMAVINLQSVIDKINKDLNGEEECTQHN
jgi:hypothetical protein